MIERAEQMKSRFTSPVAGLEEDAAQKIGFLQQAIGRLQ